MDIIEKNYFNNNRHPWEISRASCILELLKGNPEDFCYADIGAGDFYFTNILKSIPHKHIYAVENNVNNLEKQCRDITCLKSIEDLPERSIDVIILMDVLEHIEDEDDFLDTVSKTLKLNGKIIITVPANKILFSDHDRFMNHFRRYDRKHIIKFLERNGFDVSKCHYFYTTLFFIRGLEKLFEKLHILNKKRFGIGTWAFKTDSAVTRLLSKILDIDFNLNAFLCEYKIFLTGLSLCVICQKKSY